MVARYAAVRCNRGPHMQHINLEAKLRHTRHCDNGIAVLRQRAQG